MLPKCALQERQRADDAEASSRALGQRVAEANRSLTTQQQFADAAAAVAASEIQALTQRATVVEQQAKVVQDTLSSTQVRHALSVVS